tara:strand:+ start:16456 stop:16581 length:126 start_codon:yes stop_codon:yes gene_type:complete
MYMKFVKVLEWAKPIKNGGGGIRGNEQAYGGVKDKRNKSGY